MAVTCDLDPSLADTTGLAITPGMPPGAAMVIVVFSRASGGGIGAITSDAVWLTSVASGTDGTNAAAVFVGILPDPVPASIIFSATNSDRWAINGQILQGVDTVTPVAAFDSDAHFVAAASQNFSVGPITVPFDNSYLVYCLACFSPNQASFELGPVPALTNRQLGRTVALTPAAEVGIWADFATAGSSGVYTQTVTQGTSQIEGLAVLLVLQPICA